MLMLFLKPILLMEAILLPAWILFRFYLRTFKKTNSTHFENERELILLLFITYLAAVLALTILPAAFVDFNNAQANPYNLIPLAGTIKSVTRPIASNDLFALKFALLNLFGNLLIFIPMGIFLPWLFRQTAPFKNTVVHCFFISLSIEIIQMILRQFGTLRTVDIDDVILNSIGGMVGWMLYKRVIDARFVKPLF